MKPTSNRSTGRKMLLIVLPVLAIVLTITAIIGLLQPKDDADRIAANILHYSNTNALERPALERSARNTAAQTDANYLITAAAQSISANQGRLPNMVQATANGDGILVCNNACTGDESNATKLTYYANNTDAVKLVPYREGLAVTDMETIVLVSGATCQGEVVSAGSSRSMAVMYGREVGRTIESQCTRL